MAGEVRGPDPPELRSGVHAKSGENFFRTGGWGGDGQPLNDELARTPPEPSNPSMPLPLPPTVDNRSGASVHDSERYRCLASVSAGRRSSSVR